MLYLVREQIKRKPITSEILKRTHKRETLDMNSTIQTVFIVYGAMICLAYIGFAAEKCYLILKHFYTKAEVDQYLFKIYVRRKRFAGKNSVLCRMYVFPVWFKWYK